MKGDDTARGLLGGSIELTLSTRTVHSNTPGKTRGSAYEGHRGDLDVIRRPSVGRYTCFVAGALQTRNRGTDRGGTKVLTVVGTRGRRTDASRDEGTNGTKGRGTDVRSGRRGRRDDGTTC